MKSVLCAFALLLMSCGSEAASLPRIVAGPNNPVPPCVTPTALMDFVAERNAAQKPPRVIDPRFAHIATTYQSIGRCVARAPEKCVPVRWDYAFFQMLLETNYLTFRRPDGVPASVTPQDNNFAGVGAAVSGKPGERFKDAATGVLAHLQHVLMYATMRIPNPVANRTRQVEDDVQAIMRKLGRPVTFADLVREWTGTAKSRYASELQQIAAKFSAGFCRGPQASEQASLR